MSVHPFRDGEAFDPETISKMSAAFEGVCKTLRLKTVDDPTTRLIARKIIELVQRGIKDVRTLRAMTLEQLKQE
jgi:hypothetical protein